MCSPKRRTGENTERGRKHSPHSLPQLLSSPHITVYRCIRAFATTDIHDYDGHDCFMIVRRVCTGSGHRKKLRTSSLADGLRLPFKRIAGEYAMNSQVKTILQHGPIRLLPT